MKKNGAKLPEIRESFDFFKRNSVTFDVPHIEGFAQESRREGWTDAAVMLCKLNKSL